MATKLTTDSLPKEASTDSKFDLINFVYNDAKKGAAYMADKHPERSWMFDVQEDYWGEFANARENGKKVVFISACAPIELIYAFDCVPVVCDIISTRMATMPELAAKYVDFAEKYVPNSMCGIDKVPVGAILSGDMDPDIFDAGVFTTVPCDSSRISYPAISNMIKGPSITIDIPFQKDDQGYQYIARQYADVIPFLENLTGKKMDWDRFQEVADLSNQANKLMVECADTRMWTPCPLPGAVLFLNQIIPGMVGKQSIVDCLEMELESAKMMNEMGIGAVGAAEDEHWRIVWLQNMLWSNLKILGWLEKKYGAVLVMETFGYQEAFYFEDPKDPERVLYDEAKKALALPMIHGSSGPVEDYLRLADLSARKYNANVALNVGHVACKHAWAAGKVVKDYLEETFNIPTMQLDVDAVDSRYKSPEEMKEVLGEFFDNLNEAKKKGDIQG